MLFELLSAVFFFTLSYLPAGSQVTERNQRRFQASGLHVHFADGLLPKQKFL